MWYLSEVDQKKGGLIGPKYWLGGVDGGGRTIGRKHVDIRMRASSVSRKHADILVNTAAFYTPTANRRQRSCISVVDSSAYGTFLKYNPSDAPRHVTADGHHRRLDKDTPTDIFEGAMLAFGAPTVWWRLCWCPVVITSTRLTIEQNSRIRQIAQATALELAEDIDSDVTHLIVHEVCPYSPRFLKALATGLHIVTPAWVEAVHSVVSRACNTIAETGNKEAATKATELPDEAAFLPPFSESQSGMYLEDQSISIFDKERCKARKKVFKNIIFAFPREERRSKFSALIEAVCGKTIMTESVTREQQSDMKTRIIYIADSPSPSNSFDQIRQHGRVIQTFSESAIMCAIVRGNLTPFVPPVESEAQQPLENAEAGTPGPLDVESDPESEGSDGTNLNTHTGEKVQPDLDPDVMKEDFVTATDVVGVVRDEHVEKKDSLVNEASDVIEPEKIALASALSNTGKKRVRGVILDSLIPKRADHGVQATIIDEDRDMTMEVKKKRSLDNGTNIDSENVKKPKLYQPEKEKNEQDSIAKNNKEDEREFFEVKQQMGSSITGNTSKDVRTFRKISLPSAIPIPLKKVKYTGDLPEITPFERKLIRARRARDGRREEKNDSESEK